MYVFVDESGDLNFGDSDSNYFIMAALATNNLREIELLMKRKKSRLFSNYGKISELKFYNSNDEIRKRVLNGLARKDFSISALIVEKESIHDHLRNKKNIYYGYISQILLSTIACNDASCIDLIIDRSMPKKQRGEFNTYVKYKLEPKFKDLEIRPQHLDSKSSYGLQAVDFIAGAIFQKFENSNPAYFNIIKDKINMDKGFIVFKKW